ncbi:hypothetical protein FUA23_19840 [Neolewinella aurantiaca]|uniref:Uncharacterized protein n=1 Tax=Neolewinella aurantiaca TaxID=2602767 RepID=A0A5C7F8R9_9BACT|nr:hypothetical protein [Neolewinella aurantiaca]TXF85990.1 hypothetical protein FUA23_19840 [Neolewinella aurantiaca]
MPYFFLLALLLTGTSSYAQTEPKPTSFHFELDFFLTRPTMVRADNDLKNRVEKGGAISFAMRRNLSPQLSLEAGLGVQFLGLRQRKEDLLFGCNLPPEFGGDNAPSSYLDATVALTSATVHVAPIFHLEGDRDGVYLKPKLRFNYNIGDTVDGDLHECGRDEGTAINVGSVTARKLTLFPGIGFGYQGENENGKFSYIEVNFAMSAGKTFTKEAGGPAEPIGFWQEGGAMLGGVTIGWQIGGGTKKKKRMKKVQPAPEPGYYFFQ